MYKGNKTSENARTIHHIPASRYKVAAHRERIRKYLAGDNIYPVTLELDLTSRCNHACPDCPSTRAKKTESLDFQFVKNLFSTLGGHTPGLLLTGGEPTLSPLFPDTLALARHEGFQEIAVVTNGTRLTDPVISEALMAHATTIRLSIYDHHVIGCEGSHASLKNIRNLRQKIDQAGSPLKIGVSCLTSSERTGIMETTARNVHNAGAHWLYYHPMCSNWGSGAPSMMDQSGVTGTIHRLMKKNGPGFEISYADARYRKDHLQFNGYHGAHFLMIVGADRKNYLGAEVKYHPDHVIASFPIDIRASHIWDARRLGKISRIQSETYSAIGSRHRGELYSDFIERIKNRDSGAISILNSFQPFTFPSIL